MWSIFLLPIITNLYTVAQDLKEIDIDAEFIMSDIAPSSLLMRRLPPQMFNGTGPAMREKVYQMQKLYQKHRSQGLDVQDWDDFS